MVHDTDVEEIIARNPHLTREAVRDALATLQELRELGVRKSTPKTVPPYSQFPPTFYRYTDKD